ncbi:MAG: 3-hydroxybutyryl-CoA dehydrogenase, partial [Deltaproteobacteria bacterium]|nr:3-hydroxybutyryl-CoA dehydrogenase [Deltaproteobacteria bacterium]
MEITRIMIIGAGAMGAGIAQVAAQAGYRVILNDVAEA